MKFPRSLTNIWVLVFLLVPLLWLLVHSPANALDPAERIAQLEDLFVPVIQDATAWSLKVGIGITSASAFYALVVQLVRRL